MYKKKSKGLFAGKKGVVDDLFDMMFIVIVIFFGVFFMYFVFTSSAATKEEASIATVNSIENEQILLQLLQLKIINEGIEYTGAEFIIYSIHNDESELLHETFSELMTDWQLTGSLIFYKGSEQKIEDQFTIAYSYNDYQDYLWSDEAASIVLENPATSLKYLVEFYGESK